jgi:predicted nucleic acid-binding protein
MELFPVASATPKSLVKAFKGVKEYGLSFWDALIWAVVAEAGVDILLSEDFQHSRVLEGVEFCNPFEMEDPMAGIFKSKTTGQ